MPGYHANENAVAHLSNHDRASKAQALLCNIAIGVFAGIAMSRVRLDLDLPGHKLLFWMIPLLITRIVAPHKMGMTAGASAAGLTSLALGGNFAGGLTLLPLITVSGAMIDGAIAYRKKLGLHAWTLVPILAVACGIAGLICAAKRLMSPSFNTHYIFGLTGIAARLVSYSIFGMISGLVGSVAGLILRRRKKNRDAHR
jgi:LPXTG-motif cell wall-anchored protein